MIATVGWLGTESVPWADPPGLLTLMAVQSVQAIVPANAGAVDQPQTKPKASNALRQHDDPRSKIEVRILDFLMKRPKTGIKALSIWQINHFMK